MKTVVYTNEIGESVNVYFDDLQGEVNDSIDRSVYYGITGYDDAGNKYSAESEFCCSEFEGIEIIEQI